MKLLDIIVNILSVCRERERKRESEIKGGVRGESVATSFSQRSTDSSTARLLLGSEATMEARVRQPPGKWQQHGRNVLVSG